MLKSEERLIAKYFFKNVKNPEFTSLIIAISRATSIDVAGLVAMYNKVEPDVLDLYRQESEKIKHGLDSERPPKC